MPSFRNAIGLTALCTAVFGSLSLPAWAETADSGAWDGCYIGARIGSSQGSGSAVDRPFTEGPLAGTGTGWNFSGATQDSIDMSSASSLSYGLGYGCDQTVNAGSIPLVVGIKADFASGFADGSGTSSIAPDTTASYDIDAIATLRGRVGLPQQNVLYYVTGGLAWAKMNSRATDQSMSPGIGLMDVSGSGSDIGWAAGVGVEWQMRKNWSLSLEVLHHEFEGPTATGAAIQPAGSHPRFDTTLRQDTVSIGLNWRM